MTTQPWGGFNNVDRSDDPRFYIQYLDELRNLADTDEYKRRSFDALTLGTRSRVLDVGSGVGHDCQAMTARIGPEGKVAGVDPSAALVAEAQKRARAAGLEIEYRVGDVYQLPFADSSFDACRADRVFLYLDRPATALAEMARVLAPGGVLYVRDPDLESYLIDSVDKALTRKLANFFADSFKGGWIGRQLPRLFQEVGIRHIHYVPQTLVLHKLEEL